MSSAPASVLSRAALLGRAAPLGLTVMIERAATCYPRGKREEYEFCRDTLKHPLMALYQDYDWADEVNHAQFGHTWIVQ